MQRHRARRVGEGRTIASIEIGFGRRTLREKHRVGVAFDMSPAAWHYQWASILHLCGCGSQSSCRFCGAVFRDDERFEPE
jgi:hypothetical protein